MIKKKKSRDHYGVDHDKILKKAVRRQKRIDRRNQRDIKEIIVNTLLGTMYTVITVLVIVIICSIGLIYYFNRYAFNNDFDKVTVTKYLEQNKEDVIKYYNDRSIDITISPEVFNTILISNKEVLENNLIFDYKLIDIAYNFETKELQMNGRKSITLLPISSPVEFKVEDDDFVIMMKDVKLGAKDIQFPKLLINGILETQLKEIRLPLKDMRMFPAYMSEQQVRLEENQAIFNVAISQEDMIKTMQVYAENADPMVKEFYMTRPEDHQYYMVANILYNEDAAEGTGSILVKDLFSEQKLLSDFIALLDYATITAFYNDFGYVIKEDKDKVMKQKEEVIRSLGVEMGYRLLVQLEQYIKTNDLYVLSHGGRLYDVENQQYITTDTIKSSFQNSSDVYVKELAKSTLYFDTKKEEYLVKYQLNTRQTLLVYKNRFAVKGIDQVDELYPETQVKPPMKEPAWFDEETSLLAKAVRDKKGISDRVFFRYLKVDQQFAFGIASLQSDYQKLVALAFRKDADGWKLISENDTYYNLNMKNPDFNVRLLPHFNYREVSMREISEMGVKELVKQLRYRGLYQGGSVRFCSLMGDYIYVFMSNDTEFVIKIENNGLGEVKSREEAEKDWELPLLLTRIK